MDEPRILSVGRAFPPHYAPQEALTRAFRTLWPEQNEVGSRIEPLHEATRVQGRYLSLPLEELTARASAPPSFKQANDTFIRVGLEVGERAIRDALAKASVNPKEIDFFYYVTVTGLSTPSLDATLINRLGMRPDVKRIPIFGLGCAGGAGGLGRLTDLLRGHPESVALFLSVELCTVTVQRDDLSMTNAIATGLFGDGAAAVVLSGGGRPFHGWRALPRCLDSSASLIPDSEWVMGWEFVDTGFKVVLSPEVPNVIHGSIASAVDPFLSRHGLTRGDIRHWICHPGGPKVLRALESALELPPESLARSWRSLEAIGNLSSASVLLILGDTLEEANPEPGDWGLVVAMGPGFGSELVLLRW